MLDTVKSIFESGGWVMYPLLLLSFVSVMLSVERFAFWFRTNSGKTDRTVSRLTSKLRTKDISGALDLASSDSCLYSRFASAVIRQAKEEGEGEPHISEGAALEMVENFRPAVERFSAILATIVAAAPLMGILGTVTGIIESFKLLGAENTVTDPTLVAAGIAQALYTTAFGLIIALVTLFPHVWFHSQADRCLGKLETLAIALTESTTLK